MDAEPTDYGDNDPDCCPSCGGEGFYHDCGEDTCCCDDPDDDICPECGGSGAL